MWKSILIVGFGGMIGSILRFVLALLIRPTNFPIATFAVNIIGCFVIGIVMGLAARSGAFDDNWKLFLATGICGGFTTFSAFSYECIQLMDQQRYATMFAYISLSVVLGLAATFAGVQLAKL